MIEYAALAISIAALAILYIQTSSILRWMESMGKLVALLNRSVTRLEDELEKVKRRGLS